MNLRPFLEAPQVKNNILMKPVAVAMAFFVVLFGAFFATGSSSLSAQDAGKLPIFELKDVDGD